MFAKEGQHPIVIWSPDPDDSSAHNWTLDRLTHMGLPFSPGALSTRIQGNLGECLCMLIGASVDFEGHRCFPANAHQPLQDISRSELDIVWVWLDQNPLGDYAVLQEVKTTGAATLDYANQLIPDYEKLFGADPSCTLHTRLQAIANILEYGHGDLVHADRVRELCGLSPQLTTDVTLLPSVVCDRLLVPDPVAKMSAIRQALIALGWAPDSVLAWAVRIGDLLNRLTLLKAGEAGGP